MKSLKKILLSLFIAAAVGTVSTSVLAESDPGRISYTPVEAIDLVVGNIKIAIAEIDKGANAEDAAALIKKASDGSKEINANDKVDIARSKANNKLKSAFKNAKASDLPKALEELKEAEKSFEALKGLI
ncbi:MAG: hypothetical protein NTU70_06545 [Methylococcales bacterium]|nr:hypothetical protein [Methylococcales bacterium]